MSIRGLNVVRMRALAVVAPLACCCALAATIASSGAAAGGGDVTLHHKSSGFSIRAPRGSKLTVRKGVYVIKGPGLTVSFSRSVTAITPSQFGTALLGQLGGAIVSRAARSGSSWQRSTSAAAARPSSQGAPELRLR